MAYFHPIIRLTITMWLVIWGLAVGWMIGADNSLTAQVIPETDVPIPTPVSLPVTISTEPNQPGPVPYTPSQLFAPFPERLLPPIRERTVGITGLAADEWQPLEDGVQFLEANDSLALGLCYRRAGVSCQRVPLFYLRMERTRLAAVRLGIREGQTFWPLEGFAQRTCVARPGRVIYELRDPGAQLAIRVVALMPLAPPAYGLLARFEVRNLANRQRQIELLAIAKTSSMFQGDSPPQAYLRPGVVTLRTPGEPAHFHDPDYSVLVGFDGDCLAGRAPGKVGLCSRPLLLSGRETQTAYLAVVLDSPGWDEAAARERIEEFFARNPHLPIEVRKNLVEQALDTFARIPVNGATAFVALRANPRTSFDTSLRQWENGGYRDATVRFEMSDKKLQALANLTANFLFPTIIQPPGMVHNAQFGDEWNYIFCYRHVHAASDLAFEPQALGYLRLLSANNVLSVCTDFRTRAHPTLFEESYVDSLWHYYKWTGDLEAVRELWPALCNAVDRVQTMLDPDGDGLYKDTLHQWKSDGDSRGPSSPFQTALVWRALNDMVEFARALGDDQAAAEYQAQADNTYRAVHAQLWSDEYAMLGSVGRDGILRVHPQSLEIETPIWTGLMDPFQTEALLDWSTANLEYRDEAGGRYMYDNDWWPAAWSQHVPAIGDELMVAWAQMLGGRHDIGNDFLRTIAAVTARSQSPGIWFVWSQWGQTTPGAMATAMGGFIRALVEGTFGVQPALDQKRLVLHPRFPSDWDHARFCRPGLDFTWDRRGQEQVAQVTTYPDVRAVVELSVNTPVTRVTLDGRPVPIKLTPAMYWGVVRVVTPPGGGRVAVYTEGPTAQFNGPEEARVGEATRIGVEGVENLKVLDRFGMIELISAAPDEINVRPRRQGTGRCLFFLECTRGNLRWIQPVALQVGPRRAMDVVKRTVDDPLPPGAHFVPVDLSGVYTHDIQKWRSMPFWVDMHETPGDTIAFWDHIRGYTPCRDLPRRVRVGQVPFLLGPMGPGEQAAQGKDLIDLTNLVQYPSQSGITFQVGRRLHKLYLLGLNVSLSMKSYVPAVQVRVQYDQGEPQTTWLIPPLNFDSCHQDFAINTRALTLPLASEELQNRYIPMGYDLGELHLTMTDVICDPLRRVESITLRSVATETYFGLAGLTLAEGMLD